jgi:hypothetical protein
MKVRTSSLLFNELGRLYRMLIFSSQSLIPVVMSGIIAVYGLVVSVLIVNGCK